MLFRIKTKILSELRKFDENATIEFSEHCDFTSTIAFKLAKKEKKNAHIIGEEIRSKIYQILKDYVEVKCVDGYINFYLTEKFYAENLHNILNFKLKKKGNVILEHTSVNPSGPIHVGRIRNTVIGDSIARILKFCNYDVETHYYVNDMGKQIAIIVIARQKNLKKDIGNELSDFTKNFVRNDYLILPYYIAGQEHYKSDEDFKAIVDETIRKAETGDINTLNLMKETAKFCLDGQKVALKNLDISFDKFDFESTFIENKKTDEIINFLCPNRKSGEVAEISLEEYGIKREKGKIVLARSNGTSVYLARDIAYHLYKISLITESENGKILNVFGEDHKQEFLELKTILTKKFNVNIDIDAIFLSFVNFEGKRFSTRKGNIVTIDELMNSAVEKAKEIMVEKGFATEGYKEVGIGSVKYTLLKIDPQKQINFRLEDALNFEGETACYIQYAYARICRIIEKGKLDEEGIKSFIINLVLYENLNENLEEEELNLMRNLIKFYDVVEKASVEFKPNLIAFYLYNLATLFNRFYDKCPVLNAKNNVKNRRVLLIILTKFVLRNGLNLLGIKVVEKM